MEARNMALTTNTQSRRTGRRQTGPRFGGILWRLARWTSPVGLRFAGRRWNPIFAVVEHRGRRTGRMYAAPVAARRVEGTFVIALAFGEQVDWNRNLLAAGAGSIRWRGRAYPVGTPERIDAEQGRRAFHAIQRFAMRMAGIDGFVRVPDRAPAAG
jgi:deazaflavin-dependent oxidoreductase (nitroreductase family)